MKSVPIPFILVALVAQTLLLQQPACAGFLITVVVAECNQGMIWVPPPRAVKHMCLQCLCITPTYSVCKTVLLLPHAACTTIEITTPGTTTTTEEATTTTSTSTTTEEGESEEEGSEEEEEEERRRRVKGGRRVRYRKV